ncbi:phosphoadenosine phosphosulfate reductase-like protein [Angomonas deanei]|nr:phosphoadenosine phosphosulfate reductase-like protein [Angomonas deanei]CAD2219044.1 Phosphoadenosine phosphosulfate reductase family, putative [Angomonas deanei]|eukprot:EPY24779.1 phosphoadenosine phosphosulfate reductase-like protein [Angomonas deanei]
MSLRLPGKKMLEFPAEDGLCAGLWRVKREIAIDVVFMGTRQDDPNGKYQFSDLAPTTEGWPPMLRACPLFYWTYSEVWKYTLHHHIPYCKLYDYGYTSIGSPSSTRPNDSLLLPDGTYGQAWTLVEHDRERSGRFVAGGD